MNKRIFPSILLATLAVAPFLGGAAHATPIAFTGAYSQDFDTLANIGQTNFTVPPGFEYAKVNTLGPSSNPPGTASYGTSTGSSTTGNVYSFGAAGSTERAFGSLASSNAAATTLRYGFGFTNTTGQTLSNLRINYTGEQWRNGGDTSTTPTMPQSLTFDYRTGALATDNILTANTSYTSFSGLNFTSPIATTTAGALDGNATANSSLISANITGISIANNETFWLRWTDLNDTGNDHGLAIDNFTVSSDLASVAPVPELSTGLLLALGIGGFGMFQLAARKRKTGAGFSMPGNLAI